MGPILLDIAGTTLTEEDKDVLRHPLVGGVIFFKRNYESPEQMIELVREIRTIRSPLLLCVDQEGGRVQRFVNGVSQLPRIRSLGDVFDAGTHSLEETKKLSESIGLLMALEMRSLGLDLSFAPVLDLDRGMSEVIGDRAFHRDPKIVSQLAEAYIKGMNKAGMQAVGKHFPGHGAVTVDSHLGLPLDERSWHEIEEDCIPFEYLIKRNLSGIMPAHIVFPQIDSKPVGFSDVWLKRILREQCGFKGTIVSDDLSMEGAAIIGDYVERTRQAIHAGCDYVLICNHRPEALQVLNNFTFNDNEFSQQARLNLLAKKEVPSWPELKKSESWLVASRSPLELECKTA